MRLTEQFTCFGVLNYGTVTFTAVKRDSDGAYYAYIDEADFPEGVTRETFETEWFSDMDYTPEGTSAGVGG